MRLLRLEVYTYISLFIATTFVNKYVLSELKFTYPTIFQGWQTLVGTILLRGLIQTGKVHIDLTALNRTTVAPWVPGMMLFLVAIYSGSVALSKLPVPVYMALHNVVYIFLSTAEVISAGVNVTVRRYILLMTLLVSVIFISWFDSQYNAVGYFWMCIHIVSAGLMAIYESLSKSRVHLGDLDKTYLNYIYSLTVLIPCTYFLGDAMAAKRFQFWFYYRFYAGCFISGVCGVFVAVYRVKCKDLAITNNSEELACYGKVFSSLLSIVVFPSKLSAASTLWIVINLAACVMLNQEAMTSDATGSGLLSDKDDKPPSANHSSKKTLEVV